MYQKAVVYNEIDKLKKAINYVKSLPVVERRKLARVLEVMQERRAMLIQGMIEVSHKNKIHVGLFRSNYTGQWVLLWRDKNNKRHLKSIGPLSSMNREKAEEIRRWFEDYLNNTINNDN